MRAVVVTRSGGPEVLEVRDEPEPTAGPGQLLVDVEAIGVNFRDIYEREGNYGGPPPLIAGVEGSGPSHGYRGARRVGRRAGLLRRARRRRRGEGRPGARQESRASSARAHCSRG